MEDKIRTEIRDGNKIILIPESLTTTRKGHAAYLKVGCALRKAGDGQRLRCPEDKRREIAIPANDEAAYIQALAPVKGTPAA